MPTGYTYPVVEGEITTFPDFAMSCARAFGALITMRDEPNNAKVPKEIKPSGHAAKKVIEINSRIAKLRAMKAPAIALEAKKSNAQQLKAYREYEADKAKQNRRLNAMLKKVHAWRPPTKDHVGMKEFMIEQLVSSLHDPKYSSPKPVARKPAEWLAATIAEAESSLRYWTEQSDRDIRMAKERTEWIKALRTSLAA